MSKEDEQTSVLLLIPLVLAPGKLSSSDLYALQASTFVEYPEEACAGTHLTRIGKIRLNTSSIVFTYEALSYSSCDQFVGNFAFKVLSGRSSQSLATQQGRIKQALAKLLGIGGLVILGRMQTGMSWQ